MRHLDLNGTLSLRFCHVTVLLGLALYRGLLHHQVRCEREHRRREWVAHVWLHRHRPLSRCFPRLVLVCRRQVYIKCVCGWLVPAFMLAYCHRDRSAQPMLVVPGCCTDCDEQVILLLCSSRTAQCSSCPWCPAWSWHCCMSARERVARVSGCCTQELQGQAPGSLHVNPCQARHWRRRQRDSDSQSGCAPCCLTSTVEGGLHRTLRAPV